MEVRGKLAGSALSFHHAGPRDLRLDEKEPLSAEPSCQLLYHSSQAVYLQFIDI